MGRANTIDTRAVRALLFDLGGVVIDLDFNRVFARWAETAGCDPAAISSRFSQDAAYQQHERGELDATSYFAALRGCLGLDLSDEEFLEGWNDLYLGPCDGIEPLLRLASRVYPIYAFTNSNPSHQSVWSSMLRQELVHFRRVFVSSELRLRKPDLDAFRRIASETGFRIQDFLFFDDSEENVQGARTAGMQSVLICSADDLRDCLEQLGLRAHADEQYC